MRCSVHPRYLAHQRPRRSKNHPEGCLDCWRVYAYWTEARKLEEVVSLADGKEKARLSLNVNGAMLYVEKQAEGHYWCDDECDSCLTRDIDMYFDLDLETIAKLGERARQLLELEKSLADTL